MKTRQSAALLVLGTSVFATSVYSQQTAPPTRPGTPGQVNPAQARQAQPSAQGSVIVTQQAMAACVAIANHEEIELAQFAANKSRNNDVKEFARMAIEGHQQFLKKLERFTPEARHNSLKQTASTDSQVRLAGASDPDRPDGKIQLTAAQAPRQDQPRQVQPGQAQPRQTQPGAAPAGVDLIQLEREIAGQCLADAKKTLSAKEGDKFDTCFMGQQIAMHAAMKTRLTVLKRHASGEFAETLAEGLESAENHLKQAEKIMEDLINTSSDRRVTSDN